jgi:ribosome-associated protein
MKLLKILNLVETGGIAKVEIDNQMVTVNGEIETRKRYKVRKGDVIEFDGNTITVS